MPDDRPNILLITADDMNWDAVGAFGCPVAGVTPNLDRLADDGMRFHGVPILPDFLRQGGYHVGILGKRSHSTPYAEFQWDMEYDQPELGQGRSPTLYGQYAQDFFAASQAAGKPFFLMANSHDPHRPFHGNDPREWYTHEGAELPSRVFRPDEIVVPGHLPDLPDVRLELAEYLSSCRRCDDTVGRILEALDAAGAADNTLVMFLSDNGMAFPFAKTNCYLNSTRTPWIVRWPGVAEAGRVDRTHFVSGIDFTPTALDVAGLPCPDGVDGASFAPVLRGEPQADRDRVFTQFHQTAGKRDYPMRCVQDRRFGYIWNPWSDGTCIFRNESQSGRTFPAMEAAAESDPEIAARVRMFLYRVPEELYDFAVDPSALTNLADDPAFASERDRCRAELRAWMRQTGDPALADFPW